MRTLHVVPGDSAGGFLTEAIRGANRDEQVHRFLDDLSCGPIDSDDPGALAAWWSHLRDPGPDLARLREFWEHAMTAEDQLVVWCGRHAAMELAFLLALSDKLAGRAYHLIDVTGQ